MRRLSRSKNKPINKMMIREKNLIPAKKGEIRNPKGKPKGTRNRATIARQFLEIELKTENVLSGQQEMLSVSEIIVMAQAKAAIEGSLKACEWLFDNAYGKQSENSTVTIDADATTANDRPSTRAELREYAKSKGLNPDAIFIKK
ncbi:MAG: DUF5681 domain-containing protein [Chlorobium sp.]